MSGSPAYTNTNPNAKGGAFNYDARTGLGYGSLGGDPNSRLGKEYSGMGDALSSPKGQWDDVDLEDLEDEDEFDELESGIESKIRLSLNRRATDSLAHKGTDTSSFGGLGNSIASVIAAGHNPSGNMVFERSLKRYITEFILSESLSGSSYVSRSPKAKNTGGKNNRVHYAIDTSTSHTNKLDNSSTSKSRGIDHGGYGQRAKTPDMYPYVRSGKATTDGAETVRELDREVLDDWGDETSNEFLERTTSDEFYDSENVRRQNIRKT